MLGRYNRSIAGLGKTKDSADVMVKKDTTIYNENGEIQNVTVYRELKHRSDFISVKRVNIYPDTLCWIRDYTYAYNEPYMKMYFAHPGYGEYPVVGVSWEQAQAFCHWRTFLFNSYQVANKGVRVQDYRLPTEAEWEYAARGTSSQVLTSVSFMIWLVTLQSGLLPLIMSLTTLSYMT